MRFRPSGLKQPTNSLGNLHGWTQLGNLDLEPSFANFQPDFADFDADLATITPQLANFDPDFDTFDMLNPGVGA